MESAVSLLKSAVFEQDEDKRLNKACRGLKGITDLLPFPKRNAIILGEEDLFKYMLLVIPLVPSTIDLIVVSIFDVFKTKLDLWKSFWKGLEFVANMEEKHIQKNATPKRFSTNVLKTIQNQADKVAGVVDVGTNRIENSSSIGIPRDTTETSRKSNLSTPSDCLTPNIFKIKKDEQIESHIRMAPSIIKRFIEVSESEQVIKKAFEVLQLLKKMSADSSDPEFDLQELVYLKLGIPSPESQKGIKRSNSRFSAKAPSLKNRRESKLSDTESETSRATSRNKISRDPESDSNNDEEEEEEEDDENEEEVDLEAQERENLLTSFQTFLCKEDTPSFAKDEFMAEAMKSSVNYEALLALMLDPKIQILTPDWGKLFPQMLRGGGRRGTLSYNLNVLPKKKAKFKDYLNLVMYQIRSHKILQCLCDEKNYRHLISVNPNILENYYNMIYISLARDEVTCNMNHLAKLTLYYLQKEEDISCNYILHFNLPFRFLCIIEFQYIQQFLLTILQFSERKPLKAKNAETFYRYCRYSEFFLDLAKAILDGEDALDMKKSDVVYKPGRIKELIQLKPNATVPEGGLESSSRKAKALRMPEEVNNLEYDFDSCKDVLLKNKSTLPKKTKLLQLSSLPYLQTRTLLSLATAEDNSNISMGFSLLSKLEKLKKYPSIREKLEQIAQKLEKTEDEKKTRKPFLSDSAGRKQSSLNQARFSLKSSQNIGGPIQALGSLLTAKDKKDSMINSQSNGNRITSNISGELAKLPLIRQIPSQGLLIRKDSFTSQRSQLFSNQSSDLISLQGPSKSNYYSMKISPFTLDESFESSAENMLGSLYPLSVKAYIQSDLDKESKKPTYQPNFVKENDQYSMILAEVANIMVKQAIENEKQAAFRVKLNLKVKDYSKFWPALFEPQQTKFFDLIFKNYLFKIRVHHIKELNSGFECGEIVNLILANCLSNQHIKRYAANILEISQRYFPFLIKQIIHSHAWIQKKNTNIYLQTHVVNEPIGPARIMLVKTLNLTLKIGKKRDPAMLAEINDTLSHTLILWLFAYSTNNFYQNEFYAFIELSFNLLGEKHALNMLLKLDLLAKMHNMLGEIYQNGVRLSNSHTDSLVCCFKRIVKFTGLLMEDKSYENLKNQLRVSLSWSELQARFDPKPAIPKTASKKLHEILLVGSASLKQQEKHNASGLPSSFSKTIKTEPSERRKENDASLSLPKIQSPKGNQLQQSLFKSQEALPISTNGIKRQNLIGMKVLITSTNTSESLQTKANIHSKQKSILTSRQF